MNSNKNGNKITQSYLTLFFITVSFSTSASDLTVPNTFVANQPAVAAEVNANFDAVETSVDDNNNRLANVESMISAMQATITTQQATIAQLQSDLNAVENNTVLELDGLLQHALIDGHDTAEFTNVNVQINDGSGDTDGAVNGKGNLSIGYHENSISALQFCSDSQYITKADCLINSAIWDNNVRTGSHNLILGQYHSFTEYGSLIAGSRNVSNGEFANVLGGENNLASGLYSNVSGGASNQALRIYSSVLGGRNNIASGPSSSVSGGLTNEASGQSSSISGGRDNTAIGEFSAISGGESNTAFQNYSSVTGGRDNSATGEYSTISGGLGNTASGSNSSVSGGEENSASGDSSSVSGGADRTAIGSKDWVAGALFEDD